MTLDTLSLIIFEKVGQTPSHCRQAVTGVIRISRLDNDDRNKTRDTHALHYRQTHSTRSVAAEPRRARSSDVTFLSSSVCESTCPPAKRRTVALIPDRCDFRLENGKINVKFPRHRPPSVRLSRSRVIGAVLQARRSLERHHRPLVAYAAPGLTGPRTLR